VTDCELLTQTPSMAALFQDITGPCRITGNRFGGLVSFYGPSSGAPTQDVVIRLATRDNVRLRANSAQLCFSQNSLSQLTIATALIERLAGNGTATDVFASALLEANTITEPNNVFVAGLLGCNVNAFLAQPSPNGMYGVMMATRATATGNLAVELDTGARLRFVTQDAASFAKAANVITVTP
jgi:hypothetical protein